MMQEAEIQSDPIEQPATENPPQEMLVPEQQPITPQSATEPQPEQPQPAPEPQPIEPVSTPSEPQPQEPVLPAQPEPPAVSETPPHSAETPQPAPTSPPYQPAEIAQPHESASPHPRSLLQRAREKIQFRKRARQEKIVALAVKKQSITNDDVEKLLRVSDATATRYLAELVRQGRLKRFGATRGTRFEPIL